MKTHISSRSIPGILLSLMLLSTGPSTADDFDRRGAYLGVEGIYAVSLFQDDVNDAFGLDDAVKLGDSAGLNARLGYRVFSWVALEAEYEWVDEMDLSYLGFHVGKFKSNTITGNLKFIVPTWRLQPYLVLGAGVALWKIEGVLDIVNQSSTGFAGRVGLGLDTYLTKNIVLSLEATGVLTTNKLDPSELPPEIGPDFSISHLYYVSFGAGLTYRF